MANRLFRSGPMGGEPQTETNLDASHRMTSVAGEAVHAAQIQDLSGELRAVERRGRFHSWFAVLGVSPAGLIPVLGLAREGAMGAVVVLSTLIALIEGWRAFKCQKKQMRYERRFGSLGRGPTAKGW